MALPFVANFTGAAAALVDPPYKDLRAGTGPTTNSKDGSGNAVSTTISIDCVSVDDSNTYTNGQSAQATLNSTLSSGNDYLYLVVNGSGNTGAATVYWFWTNGVNDTALNRNAGSAWASAVTETTANTTTASAGDVFKLSHDGSGHVTVTKNGSIIAALSFTDATPLTGGAPGFGTSSVTTVTTVKISAFTGDDVSSGITLTGQTGTFTEGTISRAITKALTGQTATFTEGTITASTGGNVTLSLTGQSATFTEGALGLNIGYTLNDGVPLTGQTASFTEGTPTGSISYTLGSQSATFTEGTIARAVSTALVGQSGTFTEGTPSAALSYPLVAQTATFTEGTISASSGGNVTLSLSGQTANFSEGILSPNTVLGLTAQSGTFSAGSLSGSISTAILGQTGTFTEGTITAQFTGNVTITLGSLTATFSEGFLSPTGGDQNQGAGRRTKRHLERYIVRIDSQEFVCYSKAEAIELLRRAQEAAKLFALKTFEKTKVADFPNLELPKFAPPKITVNTRELRSEAAQAKTAITATYRQVLIDAELRMLFELDQRQRDDDESLILLM